MKVVGISGSPRRGGNTETLLREVLRGAEEAGAETRLFILSRMNIAPCIHCDGCLAEGECVVKDDMWLIYPEIESLDALVLASPIHFYGVTAQAKAMIDRCQAFWARKYVLKRRIAAKKRNGVFVSVGGTQFPDTFEHAKATVKNLHPLSPENKQGETPKRKRIVSKVALLRDGPRCPTPGLRANRPAHVGPWTKVATYAAATQTGSYQPADTQVEV